jgi:hypothetical protein
MDVDALAHSAATEPEPPASLSTTWRVLWLARANRWDAAHDDCQDLPDPAGAWIHAHLHRQEGDLSNAAYWYARAGKPNPPASLSLAEEWRSIAQGTA